MPHLRNPFILEAVPIQRRRPSLGVRETPLTGIAESYSLNCDSQPESAEQILLRHEQTFAFDIVAYSTVGEQCHVVLRLNKPRALAWTAQDVAERWMRLFGVPPLVRRFLRKETLTEVEQQAVLRLATVWRQKLMDERCLARSLNRTSQIRIVPTLGASAS